MGNSGDAGSGTKQKSGCCAPSSVDRPRLSRPAFDSAMRRSPTATLPELVPLPGGKFLMGTDYADGFVADGEGPVREVRLRPFSLGKYPVTNSEFREFIQQTAYQTEAEQFGWSFVFWAHILEDRRKYLVDDTVAAAPWWCKVRSAMWSTPEGPGSTLEGRDRFPVVHISWNDAIAYTRWAGMRLPTEAEWEYAARGGLVQQLYPWGNKLRPDGEHRCNIWQGDFPSHDSADDGYAGSCPVDAFLPNGYGLYSMTGNTWEWCSDWFDADFHRTAPTDNPMGPTSGQSRVVKGGSFLCHKSYCNRYRVAARTANTPDSSASHMGFRYAL
jgi:sulfatase modifying factor 1